MAMLKVVEARPVEREVSIQSGVKGYSDRMFIIGMNGTGFTLRPKRGRGVRKIRFREFISWMVMHASEEK
jgi:hypothetical protein